MRTRLAFSLLLISEILFASWTMLSLASRLQTLHLRALADSHITGSELAIVIQAACLLVILVILNETIYVTRRGFSHSTFVATRMAWLLGLLAANVNSASIPVAPMTSTMAPVTTAMSPLTAVSVLAHIERRRREQLKAHEKPDVLTEEESELLREVRVSATKAEERDLLIADDDSHIGDTRLIHAVNRVMTNEQSNQAMAEHFRWVIEVKVFGYPTVVSVHGDVAEFRKKRALELLTWLALNRDRGRRSAARTALWDIDVSDSSFSTVVSDMRRALRELDVKNDLVQWVPTTYSDELPLSPLVVTDADRLRSAHVSFVRSEGFEYAELHNVLQGIRDVPFAGTNYAWADLDGTTTRLVIAAVDICVDVAQTAHRQRRNELFELAVSAGLRVFPGCEELLEIQDRHLARSFSRRLRNDTHHFA